MTTLFFGSISTIVDTSELQRQSFNDAFRQHGLDWMWDRDEYRAMLDTSGGRDRIAAYAEARQETVDADAVHQTKSELFRAAAADKDLALRDGVIDTIAQAKNAGDRLALVTSTSAQNVRSVLDAVSSQLDAGAFDLVVDASQVDSPKPSGDAYIFAIETLGVSPSDCVAVEDNVGGVTAARAAGVTCVAYPNANTADHDFAGAAEVLDSLDYDALHRHASSS